MITERPAVPPPAEPPRKRWTRAECERLETSGLWDQQHLELIAGELISKMGKKRPHVNTLSLMYTWLVQTFGGPFVNPEAPIDVAPEDNPTNEPEPDLIVLHRPLHEFQKGNPRAEDLRLVVEISDSTLRFDLGIKARLYARAGIVEYWVLDVAGKRLVVHREPRNGLYGSVMSYSEDERVAPLCAPERAFRAGDAFPG